MLRDMIMYINLRIFKVSFITLKIFEA